MTVEPPLAEQQRAVVELYLHSTWIKANLTLEDESLFIEYAYDKRAQSIPNEQSMHHLAISARSSASYETPENITSQKRTVKIVKSDNIGLGKVA